MNLQRNLKKKLRRENEMNLQFYLKKLQSSKEFKKFTKENPNAYLCSGFFIVDKTNVKNPGNKINLDFYSPKDKKTFSFDVKEEIKLIPLEKYKNIPSRISPECEFNFEDMEKMILDEIDKKNIKTKIQKIIFSLQNLKGKDFLIGAIFISSFGLLKVDIDISGKKITKFEKKSLLDMFRVTDKKKDKKKTKASEL